MEQTSLWQQQASQMTQAAQTIQQSIAASGVNTSLMRLAIEVKQRELQAGIDLPAALLQLAQLRVREGRPDLAADPLQTWVSRYPMDAAAWQALSVAYRAQNQLLRAIRAEGEAQMARMDYAGAVDRFKAARTLSAKGSLEAADHIEASIIDTRLRLAESRLREQALQR